MSTVSCTSKRWTRISVLITGSEERFDFRHFSVTSSSSLPSSISPRRNWIDEATRLKKIGVETLGSIETIRETSTVGVNGESSRNNEHIQQQRNVRRFERAYEAFQQLVLLLLAYDKTSGVNMGRQPVSIDSAKLCISEAINAVAQALSTHAFAVRRVPSVRTLHRDRSRPLVASTSLFLPLSQSPQIVWWGAHALLTQLAHGRAKCLSSPYDTVPRRSLLHGFRALTRILNEYGDSIQSEGVSFGLENDAYQVSFDIVMQAVSQILDHLATGDGVRDSNNQQPIPDREFYGYLNVLVSMERMEEARQAASLQLQNAQFVPAISAVTYSILLKGYGRNNDLSQVLEIQQEVSTLGVIPDIIMMNSMMDALVNCQALEDAKAVFDDIIASSCDAISQVATTPTVVPNRRTYNTLLKGYANAGKLADALDLSRVMSERCMWDAVTTNTMVHAAIVARDLTLAANLLENHTVDTTSSTDSRHPNVEAYTELLDTYAKMNQLDRALGVFQLMRQRAVQPNVVTYSCLVGGLARKKKVDQALEILKVMANEGIPPSTATYNAFLSGLLGEADSLNRLTTSMAESSSQDIDASLDTCLSLLGGFIRKGCRPNVATASILVTAMGQCQPPRVDAARILVSKFEQQGYIPINHTSVTTALMRTTGLAGDLSGALRLFRNLNLPDTIAVNAFLDTCCRSGRENLAVDTFAFYFRKQLHEERRSTEFRKLLIKPDVVSYSIMIDALLKKGIPGNVARVRSLYQEMKVEDGIRPDITLVDTILRGVLTMYRGRTLSRNDALFLVTILQDAANLQWSDGQLERRKRAVRALAGDYLQDTLRSQRFSPLYPTQNEDDALFARKGWNKVDSGFPLWGTNSPSPPDSLLVDDFLLSKGWNDVDSGFRMF